MHRLAFTPAPSALAGGLPFGGLLGAWVLGASLVAGCAGERAVLVDVEGTGGSDRLCLVASDGARVLFSRAYGDDVLGAPTGGTLTFVAGNEVDSSLIVTARALRAGAVVGTATDTATFGDAGTVTLPLVVSRCHQRTVRAATIVARDIVLIEAVGAGASLAAVDVDGDGRDEALVLGVGGTLVTVDVENARAVARAATGAGGRVASFGDLDGDCSLDPVVVAADGVRVLHDAGGAVVVDPAVDGTAGAVDAALGAAAGGPRIAVCGPGGVSLVAARGAAAAISLTAEASRAVVAADLTGDRRSEVIAASPTGARVWIGSDAGFIPAPDALPPSFVGVTDLLTVLDGNGDGVLDLAGGGAGGVFLALNRGDGVLEDHTGTGSPTVLPIALVALDLDGDCRDELAALGADGTLTIYTTSGTIVPRAETFAGIAVIAAGDVDGDGARELLVLGTDGRLRVVGP